MAFQGENFPSAAGELGSLTFFSFPASGTSCMISASGPLPPHPPFPPLSGIFICKMDLGTVVLDRINPKHLWKSLALNRGQIASGASRGTSRQPGPFLWRRPPGLGPRVRRNLSGSFPPWQSLLELALCSARGAPALISPAAPQGGAGKGRADLGHWRENVRNVPGASTYPKRGQRKGAGRGEGRGARHWAPVKTCLFSCGWSPVRASSLLCKLFAAPGARRPAPAAPARPGLAWLGAVHLREPASCARPIPCPPREPGTCAR